MYIVVVFHRATLYKCFIFICTKCKQATRFNSLNSKTFAPHRNAIGKLYYAKLNAKYKIYERIWIGVIGEIKTKTQRATPMAQAVFWFLFKCIFAWFLMWHRFRDAYISHIKLYIKLISELSSNVENHETTIITENIIINNTK